MYLHTNGLIPEDPITAREIRDLLTKLRRDKAAGIGGISSGILILPDNEYLNVLVSLFNLIFDKTYPEQWSIAKVFTTLKKGRAADTNNYRGISMQGALVKVYDVVLRNRFEPWYQPDVEHAGGVAGRGCADEPRR